MSTEEKLPPNYEKLDVALRSIGYSFEAAVADIIDNSIDAGASTVLVRLIVRAGGRIDLVISDDGSGMDSTTLKEAMRFGADVSQEIERLGKFGLGLKLASLSQAKAVHVLTLKDGKVFGRAWLEHGIASGFTCTVLDETESRNLLRQVIPDCEIKTSGTLVWWSHLYRVGPSHANPEEHTQRLMRRLENNLSLAFHRFLSGRPRKVKIQIDIFDPVRRKRGIPVDLDPLDPFGYQYSGREGFPTTLRLDGADSDRMRITAHIWPPNSSAPGYKLPGGANSRQGFYFYRNNRLIQGGGWNGIREVEPHSSLARLEVDIAADFDLELSEGLSIDIDGHISLLRSQAIKLTPKGARANLIHELLGELEGFRSDTVLDYMYEGHYDAAAREACIVLENELRALSNSQAFGQKMVEECFGPAGKLIPGRIPNAHRVTLLDEYRRFFKYVRNDFAHNLKTLDVTTACLLLRRCSRLYSLARSLAVNL